MNILVTGSTGFIGGHLCQALVARGHVVRAFHRPTSNLHLLEGLPVEHVSGDLARKETLKSAMDGMEAVFHAGALLSSNGTDQTARMYAINVEGTRAVLQAAREAGVRRVVLTSSVAALGVPELPPNGGPGKPPALDERHTWNFRPDYWPYGYSKYLAEMEVQKAVAGGQEVIIVNPSLVFGAGDIYRQNSSVVVHVARRKLVLLAEGGLNIIHIDDVVEGHLAALEFGRSGERYILCGENLTIAELGRQIAAIASVTAPAWVLPGALVRALSRPLELFQPFLDLPLSARELRLAGRYFYFDNRKAQLELRLPAPRPAEVAILAAYRWFRDVGALR